MADDQLFGGRYLAKGKGGLACVVSARDFRARAFAIESLRKTERG